MNTLKKEKDHIIHERKLTYYKKTIQLLMVGLEVFFLFLIAAIIFLIMTTQSNMLLQTENSQLQLEQYSLQGQLLTLRNQVYDTAKDLPLTILKDGKFMVEFLSLNNIPLNISVDTKDIFSQMQEGYQRRELVEKINIPMHNEYAQECYDYTAYFSTLESSKELKKFYSQKLINLRKNATSYVLVPLQNKSVYVMDFRDFISEDGFEDELETWFEERESNKEFITRIWSVVSQLTTYNKELGDTPRYPLETLFLGDGDCEDSAILFASMLKAAHTNWKISFLYTDLANPSNPQKYNHVLVQVQTPQGVFNVETTSKDVMEPYKDVSGILLEIN